VRLISEADRQDLITHALRSGRDAGRELSDLTLRRRARRVSEALSLLKGRAAAAREPLSQPAVGQVGSTEPTWLMPAMQAYQAWLSALDLEDLDDLLISATQVCRADPDAARYRYVHVDEYQDTNGVQRELLIALARAGAQVFAIGDPDQSIYAFRGADLGNFFAFPRDFPGARVFYLRENFRATATLVAAASALRRPAAGDGSLDEGPPPQAQRRAGERVQLRPASSPRQEAIAIAREIERLVGGTSLTSHDQGRAAAGSSGCYGFSDIAVLTRTAARADEVAAALHHEGIPILRPRKARPPDSRDDREDGAAPRADSPQATSALTLALTSLPPQPPHLHRPRFDQGPAEDTHYAALRHALSQPGEDEIGFAHESDEWDARFERVAVLTLHGSKGLEFSVVFLCGCEAELLPGRAASEEEIAEERRLFYVGMTRAKDRLWISHAGPRSPFVDALRADTVQTVAPPPRREKPPQLKLF
jgi:DNA helicase-2/ATP-dependent DNA helicase PcrA